MKASQWKDISDQISKMLESLNFGSITLIVQDGIVIQIEKNEKVRLHKPR